MYHYIQNEVSRANIRMDDNGNIDLSDIEGFEWDKGNIDKNRFRHNVDTSECEEVFFNKPQIIAYDEAHSQREERYSILGKTTKGRKLNIIFTLRNNKIRAISARDQNKKERKLYEEELKKKGKDYEKKRKN